MSRIEEIRRVLVVGSGVMGSGIAQVVARADYEVTMVDVSDQLLEAGVARITSSLDRFVRRDAISSDDRARALELIRTSTDLQEAARGCDLVIEAIVESEEAKRDLFRTLDAECSGNVIFASNTSHYSITRLGAYTSRPELVVGFHWSNPPPMMHLIEVIPGDLTSEETLKTVTTLAERCGKDVAVLSKDVEGFVSNRLSSIFFLEALRLLDEGVADPDVIDDICVKMFGHKMGPLATLDLAGLDTALSVANGLTLRYGDRFRPPELLQRLVAAGRYGKKAGIGIRDYRENT